MAQLQQGKPWVCGMGELLSMRVDVANDRLHLDGYLKDSVYAKGMLIGQTTFFQWIFPSFTGSMYLGKAWNC